MTSRRGGEFSKARDAGITFGLELEFMVGDEPKPAERLTIDQKREKLGRCLAALVPNLPIAAECTHDRKDMCSICVDADSCDLYPGMRVFTPAKVVRRPGENPDYLYFLIQNEWIVCVDNSDGFVDGHGVEISTPILNVNELEAGLPKTAQIIEALRKAPMKIATSTWCGLHVHVGLKNGMPLRVLKKAITLTMLLEQALLDRLCPISRRECFHRPPINTQSNFALRNLDEIFMEFALKKPCPELMAHFPGSASKLKPGHWNGHKPREFFERLTLLWQALSFRRIWEGLLSLNEDRIALALCLRDENQKPAEPFDSRERQTFDSTASTLEFRYPQMSADMNIIRNWAEIACKIVEISTYGSTTYKERVMNIIQIMEKSEVDKREAWEPLLWELGLGHQVNQWKEQLKSYGDNPTHLFKEDEYVMV